MLPHPLAGEPILLHALIDRYSHANLAIDMNTYTTDGYAAEHMPTVNLSGNISVTDCRAVHARKAKACIHGEWAAYRRTATASKLQQRSSKPQIKLQP